MNEQEQVAEETTGKLGEGDTLSERMENWAAGTEEHAKQHREEDSEATYHHCIGAAEHTRDWIPDVYVLEGHILGLQEENEAMIAAHPDWESLADEADERPKHLSEKMEEYARDGEAEALVAPSTVQERLSASVSVTRRWIPEVQNLQGYAFELMQENKQLQLDASAGRAASDQVRELRTEVARLEKALSLKFDEVLCAHRNEKDLESNVRLLKRIVSEFIEQAFRRSG